MPKILYVATVVRTHIMQFHIPYLKMMKEAGWETAVAAGNDYDDPRECRIPYCDEYYDIPFDRSPFSPKNYYALKQLRALIDREKYDIIHCHTPVGGAIGRLAASAARRNGAKVFYTAHGFHFFSGAPLKYWLLFYPIERMLARRTDVLITINQEDYERALHFKAGKVVRIPGIGVDLKRFRPDGTRREKTRSQMGIGQDEFVVLMVGEMIPRKNQRLVLDALSFLKERNRLKGIRCLLCGSGVMEEELKGTAEERGLAGQVMFLGYREDTEMVYSAADVFVFPSLQEGLPVAVVEALASGLPVVCTDIRGNRDLIRDGENGLIVDQDGVAFGEAVLRLRNDPELRMSLGTAAAGSVGKYDCHVTREEIRRLYMQESESGIGEDE